MELRDGLLAGTVAARGAALPTRNGEHFRGTGIALVNPWD